MNYLEALMKMEKKLTKCVFAAEEHMNRYNVAREKPILPVDTIRYAHIATDYMHLNVVDHLTKINLLDKNKKISSFENYFRDYPLSSTIPSAQPIKEEEPSKTNEVTKNSFITGVKRQVEDKGPSVAKKLKLIGFDDEDEEDSADDSSTSSSSSSSSDNSSESGNNNRNSD